MQSINVSSDFRMSTLSFVIYMLRSCPSDVYHVHLMFATVMYMNVTF